MKFKIHTKRDWQWDSFQVLITMQEHGKRYVAEPLLMALREEGEDLKSSVDTVYGKEFLQAALDAAWEVGLRPSGIDISSEAEKQIVHMQGRHLEDMRRIVFDHYLPGMKP